MKTYLPVLLAFLSINLYSQTPKNIDLKESKAVYVDFSNAKYHITYDISAKKAIATTSIHFYQANAGYPIFDLVPFAYNVRIDGKATDVNELVSPGAVTKYKIITKELLPGNHILTMQNEINESISFSDGGVQAAFWMSDLTDRNFLEKYLPTNLEFDRYQATLDVEFIGGSAFQHVYTNGNFQELSKNKYRITFPSHFVSSSFYFHTTTPNRFYEKRFNYRSKAGKLIPITIYSRDYKDVTKAKNKTIQVMQELENNFGNWPHTRVLIYIAGSGGMEYCGAAITSLSALGHELTHSYYARGVMPLNGNSGWIDEAIATWRGRNYPIVNSPNYSWSNMGGHSSYQRATDRAAYSKGANFMAYLNGQLQRKGGLKKFLSQLFNKYVFKSITTNTFKKELENFSGVNYDYSFNKYVFGKTSYKNDVSDETDLPENPFHPKLSEEELEELL